MKTASSKGRRKLPVFHVFDKPKLMCSADFSSAINCSCALFFRRFLQNHLGVVSLSSKIITKRHIGSRNFGCNIVGDCLVVVRQVAKTFCGNDICHIAQKLVAFLFAHLGRCLCDADAGQDDSCDNPSNKAHFNFPLTFPMKPKKHQLARGLDDE